MQSDGAPGPQQSRGGVTGEIVGVKRWHERVKDKDRKTRTQTGKDGNGEQEYDVKEKKKEMLWVKWKEKNRCINMSFLVFDILLKVLQPHSTPPLLFFNISAIFSVSLERVSELRLTASSRACSNTQLPLHPTTTTTSLNWQKAQSTAQWNKLDGEIRSANMHDEVMELWGIRGSLYVMCVHLIKFHNYVVVMPLGHGRANCALIMIGSWCVWPTVPIS